jgi:hypothetical protein
MSLPTRTFAVMILVTVVAAALAGWAGVRYGLSHTEEAQNIDATLHRDLGLTADQDRRLEVLETSFSQDRERLQKQMRAANIEHRDRPFPFGDAGASGKDYPACLGDAGAPHATASEDLR